LLSLRHDLSRALIQSEGEFAAGGVFRIFEQGQVPGLRLERVFPQGLKPTSFLGLYRHD
jgi:hypothetical protein